MENLGKKRICLPCVEMDLISPKQETDFLTKMAALQAKRGRCVRYFDGGSDDDDDDYDYDDEV